MSIRLPATERELVNAVLSAQARLTRCSREIHEAVSRDQRSMTAAEMGKWVTTRADSELDTVVAVFKLCDHWRGMGPSAIDGIQPYREAIQEAADAVTDDAAIVDWFTNNAAANHHRLQHLTTSPALVEATSFTAMLASERADVVRVAGDLLGGARVLYDWNLERGGQAMLDAMTKLAKNPPPGVTVTQHEEVQPGGGTAVTTTFETAPTPVRPWWRRRTR